MSEKPNEAKRIASDLRSWIQQPEHGPLMWMRDAIPARRVAEFADRVEALGESGECEKCKDLSRKSANQADTIDLQCGEYAELQSKLRREQKELVRYQVKCERLGESNIGLVFRNQNLELRADARTDAPAEVWVPYAMAFGYVYAGLPDHVDSKNWKLVPVRGSTQDAGEVEHDWFTVCPTCGADYHDPDCETCDTRIEYEGLHEDLRSARKGGDNLGDSNLALCDELDVANKRIAELEAEVERFTVANRLMGKACDANMDEAQRLREGIRAEVDSVGISGRIANEDGLGMRLRALLGEQEGETQGTDGYSYTGDDGCADCTHAEPTKPNPPPRGTVEALGGPLPPVPEPSDALARAREAMSRLPHETTKRGRITHVASAIGAMLDHLERGR